MEALRALARKYVKPTSPVFAVAARLYNDLEITRREGLALRATLRRLETASGAPVELRLRNLAHPIRVRPGSPDLPTILDNVIREEYAHALPADWQPRVIIDAGGFIGDTTAYFLTRYPHLRSIVVEPESDNLALARTNLAPYGDRVVIEQSALAGVDGTLNFSGSFISGSLQAGGTQQPGAVEVPATTVASLMARHGLDHVDLLKMDIEGAELDVFRATPENWLDRVDMIIAELHGPAITDEVCAILARHGFKAIHYRSLTFFRRPDGQRFS